MDEHLFDLDDELFPACAADRLGTLHTDEYGLAYVCDLVDGPGYCRVQLGKAFRRDRRPAAIPDSTPAGTKRGA